MVCRKLAGIKRSTHGHYTPPPLPTPSRHPQSEALPPSLPLQLPQTCHRCTPWFDPAAHSCTSLLTAASLRGGRRKKDGRAGVSTHECGKLRTVRHQGCAWACMASGRVWRAASLPLYSMPHLSLTTTSCPVSSARKGLGFTGCRACSGGGRGSGHGKERGAAARAAQKDAGAGQKG